MHLADILMKFLNLARASTSILRKSAQIRRISRIYSFKKNIARFSNMTTAQVPSDTRLDNDGYNENKMKAGNENEQRVCRRSCSLRRNNEDGESEGFLQRWAPKWMPTSSKSLEDAEKKILDCLTVPYESSFVEIDDGENLIRTLKINPSNSTKTPYVLVHGFGSGVALWALNLEALSKSRPVYAFDILGFGRSTRPRFPFGAEAAEAEFVRSIEEWRKAVGVEQMILVGHSMGGFLSSAYALRHPERVKHLVCLDPWGYPTKEADDGTQQLPFWARVIGTIVLSFNPLSSLRAAGPLGPWLVRKTRGDIGRKFSSLTEDDRISQYIYHSNAQYPSGEKAFKDMSSQFGWAVNPMFLRINDLPSGLPMSMVYGSRSWMDITMGEKVKAYRHNSRVDIRIIKGAGHHVYADHYKVLNGTLDILCRDIQ